jgi:RNA polymerase sigma-70 factor (ECF subfamily)
MNNPSERVESDSSIEEMIHSLQSGSEADLVALVETYRDYLLSVARYRLPKDLAVKVAPSDVVQETMLQAAQNILQFRGTTEEELRQWLQTIIMRNVIDAHRHYRRVGKRDLTREVPLDQSNADRSPTQALTGREESPSARLRQSESALALHAAVSRLSVEYQLVIRQHSFEKKGFDEIGKCLNRSPGAARKLWARAVEKLAKELSANDSDSVRPVRGPSC